MRYEPASRQCPAGGAVRIIVRERAPSASLEVRLTLTDGRAAVSISPVLSGGADQLAWTTARVEAMRTALVADLQHARVALPELNQDLLEATNDMRTLQAARRSRDGQTQAAQNSMAALERRMAHDRAEMALMRQGLKTWPDQARVLTEIGELGKQLQRGRLALRVYDTAGGQDVDVWRADESP